MTIEQKFVCMSLQLLSSKRLAIHKSPLLDLPNKPSKPKAENINKTTVKIKWTPPNNDGGSPVTGYVIEKCDVSQRQWVRVNKGKVSG